MRKVCPNLDREDGLDTVLEVPLPELIQDTAATAFSGRRRRRSGTVKAWMRSHAGDHHQQHRRRREPSRADVQIMLGVMGAPLVPQPVEARKAMAAGHDIKDEPLEVSKARYVMEQYVAAAGGEAALGSATSMYAMGNVRMSSTTSSTKNGRGSGKKSGGEVSGGFVVWQKKPELWCVEIMVVSGGTKMSAGSDGKVAWRQTPWQQAHASRGPPRPIRRCVQGLDPKSTADLFSSAAWVGEECVDGEDCFVLRVDANRSALDARSGDDVEVVRHALWGCFSQRTGLLVRLEDTHLLRVPATKIISSSSEIQDSYWETTMESSIGDYRAVDGINIAHAGRTVVSLSRFTGGDAEAAGRKMTRPCTTTMEETWSIEEVDFNVAGLSRECFLPPRDLLVSSSKQQQRLKKDNAAEAAALCAKSVVKAKKALVPAVTGLGWFGPAKVVAFDDVDAADDSKDSTRASTR